jgi:hypothetical protein
MTAWQRKPLHLAYAALALLFWTPAISVAQNAALNQEAANLAWSDFTQSRWLPHSCTTVGDDLECKSAASLEPPLSGPPLSVGAFAARRSELQGTRVAVYGLLGCSSISLCYLNDDRPPFYQPNIVVDASETPPNEQLQIGQCRSPLIPQKCRATVEGRVVQRGEQRQNVAVIVVNHVVITGQGAQLPPPEQGTRAPNIAGRWRLARWGGMFDVTLEQDGPKVRGSYSLGTIEGTLSGNVLNGKFSDINSGGVIRLVFTADGNHLQGVTSTGEKWTGDRVF